MPMEVKFTLVPDGGGCAIRVEKGDGVTQYHPTYFLLAITSEGKLVRYDGIDPGNPFGIQVDQEGKIAMHDGSQ